MKNITALFLLLTSLMWAQANAQEVKSFRLVNAMNNKTVALEDFASNRGLIIIFTSNSCPYDDYYRSRFAQLAQTYGSRIPLLFVNAHTEADESVEKMNAKGRALGFSVPYLADKEQALMTDLGVRKSPEAFLLKNDNGKFSIVYRGAIDDNAQVESDVRHPYLRDAIEALLGGAKIVTPDIRPVGCNIKKKI